MTDDGEKIRAEKGYELIITEGYILSDKEAAGQGLVAEFEDVIDSLWACIPTIKKLKTDVYTADCTKLRPAALEWQDALEIKAPSGLPSSELRIHPSHKLRALRKKQILTDVLSSMKLLYKEPRVSRMAEPGVGEDDF
jgi:hypothetical protein